MPLTLWFPLLAVVASVLAMAWPQLLVPLKPAIVPLLGVVMFGMGMTLTPASFAGVLSRPRLIATGVAMQYTLMPLIAWSLGRLLGLDPLLAAGVVLVGSCPGGTASNVICYLARGDVALSITLTALSTLLSVLATPLLTWLLIGQRVEVPAGAMLLSILKIVILPVVLGLIISRLLGRRVGPVLHLFPLLSVAAIVLIIAIIVALNAGRLASLALPVVLAVMLHNLLGLGAAWGMASLLGYDERTRRTLAIEVGMQNSGLGVALALKHFTAAAALPGAVYSIWHNLSGAALAAWWSRRPAPASPRDG
ncbi:MAG: bile acid:sodium symporter family protein [Gammaproteobacteria bacterium]|nr:MAG: bile acid:sodium symporter family protein [Gammaproteobacteria bacterium]